ncbi:tRNA methyltransferase 10 homolog C [Aplysia californica]|uniref:RNA (guanine-9-)-methyltransferase domain-containing protein 1 n=1 Tax=Aplysia californica TaxID=6500 RepID=A0ABM0ZZE3_APLCA|nr:tRNA methyltransferase 10 homolog C [Aplysia californica]
MSHKRWLEAMTFSTMDERLEYYLSLETDKGNEEKVQDFNGQFTSDRTEGSARKDHISNAALSVPAKEPNNSISHSDEQLCDERLQSAMQGGIPLMIDMDYVGHMSCQELDACGEQLWLAYCNNRQHINPFHLVLSGCKPDNASYRYMELLHQGNKPHFFATVTEKSPVDLRPASELVYLSSKAKEVLTVFDPNKVYILGAYSNKKTIKHPCIMKASKQNIRAMRLPIDEHVRWPGGPKNLLLQDILKVLLAVKDGASWKEALKPIILHGASIPHWIREAKKKDKLPSKTRPQPVKKNRNKV